MPRVFHREFKLEVCRAIVERWESKHSQCLKYGLGHGMLDRWVIQYIALGEDAFQGSEWRRLASMTELRVQELEKELEAVRSELDRLRRELGKPKSR